VTTSEMRAGSFLKVELTGTAYAYKHIEFADEDGKKISAWVHESALAPPSVASPQDGHVYHYAPDAAVPVEPERTPRAAKELTYSEALAALTHTCEALRPRNDLIAEYIRRTGNAFDGPCVACFFASHELAAPPAQGAPTPPNDFTLPEINASALTAGIASPRWNALEKQLAKALLAAQGPGTREAGENLADYLLRNRPPTWNYETVLRLAEQVALAQPGAPTKEG